MIETLIYTVLTADADIKARVNTRIYPVRIPQNPVYPAITYYRASAGVVNTLAGYSGKKNPTIIINAFARTYAEVKDMAKELLTAMDGARTFRAVLTWEDDDYNDDLNLYAISQEYSVWGDE